jgi:predicted restriction endonuclease
MMWFIGGQPPCWVTPKDITHRLGASLQKRSACPLFLLTFPHAGQHSLSWDRLYVETGEKEAVTKHRIGQGSIRQAALKRYGNQCCLCKIDDPSLLVAGHIKGWAMGKMAQGDPKNVVLMCALHDSLFGKGFITLDPSSYRVRISSGKLSDQAREQIKKVTLAFRSPATDLPHKKYLVWHRNNLFQK